MPVSRTLGPLHFEDLEPKRFEDLARQLIYDFRLWRRLEPTGRAGSDDGFDARGFEIVAVAPIDIDAESDDNINVSHTDRLWLIQCKREKVITPTALQQYLNKIKLRDEDSIHGLLFVAACDFSKRSRDVFRAECEARGIKEWYLWGKADLEDLLFRPENDHLLFAYFGVSLIIRRRGVRSQLRTKLAAKRKVKRVLDDRLHQSVLLRSSEDTHYPYSGEVPNFEKRPPWTIVTYQGITHNGVLFTIKRHFAYIDDDGKHWDAAFVLNDLDGHAFDNPWSKALDNKLRQQIYEAWSSIQRKNQAWLEIHGLVPFENIVDIDEHGDDIVEAPHVFIDFTDERSPFSSFTVEVSMVDTFSSHVIRPENDVDSRVEHFKPEWRVSPDFKKRDST